MEPSSPPRRRIWPRLLLIVLAAGGGYALWREHPWAPNKPQVAQAPRPVPVIPVGLAKAEKASVPVWLDGLGTVQAYNSVLVRTRIDGQIDKIRFREGDSVKAGDVLVEIDPRPLQAALEQAQAKKSQDEANLANAKLDLQRYTQLGDFASKQQKDTQTALVQQGTALVAADQAAIDNAQTQLGYATIRAPINGVAGFRQVDAGNIVNATTQTGIVTLTQIEPIGVVFTVPEDQLGDVNAALAKGSVTVDAYSTDGRRKLSGGRLETVNNQVDTATGTIRLKAVFDNQDHALWPGLSVSTRLLLRTLDDAVTVPDDAVQRGPNGLFVYVVDAAKKAQPRAVLVSLSSERHSVISKGITAGETVIVQGQYRVQPGATVAEAQPEKTAAVEN